ncbi:hypothetical protein RRG08_043951 [Elysia crispata]|uniref:Uncharacterized protein n=1 Tax=Elysia crispata TaxID=231223 RepID=A0AAE0Y087_9GAST|nr:hypothetical protein RRG08_043951 [Elysia crispata]
MSIPQRLAELSSVAQRFHCCGGRADRQTHGSTPCLVAHRVQ